MKKLMVILTLSLLGPASFASDFLEFGADDFNKESLKKSRFVFDLGANYLQYPTNIPSFNGKHENIKEGDAYDVYGVSVGFGREFHLTGGLSTTLKLGGFYSKSLEQNIGKAAEDIDLELASNRSAHAVWGGEVSGAINYMFETSWVNIQPFIEFGVGSGRSDIEKEYEYKGLAADGSDAENYDIRLEEEFNYAKTAIGVNFISNSGILSYFKVTQYQMDIQSRNLKGSISESPVNSFAINEEAPEDELSDALSVTSLSVGFGILF